MCDAGVAGVRGLGRAVLNLDEAAKRWNQIRGSYGWMADKRRRRRRRVWIEE
jgi:hypothetical protein